MEMTNYLGYVMAISVGFSLTTGTRLFKTGELYKASKKHPLLILVLTLVYGAMSFSAIGYFSWAYLSWKQLLTFLLISITFGSAAANSNSLRFVFSCFTLATIVGATSQLAALQLF